MDIRDLLKRCVRILYISRKPSAAEYSKVAKVTATGMLLFGLVGFIISTLANFVNSSVPALISSMAGGGVG
ncbi:MAG: protein translocase SEC61 complex subunit gamma [Candidatus Micrarchaeota archaeon]